MKYTLLLPVDSTLSKAAGDAPRREDRKQRAGRNVDEIRSVDLERAAELR